MSGKGSGRRPQQVDDQTVASNWARIFGKKAKPITVTVPADLPGCSTAASATGSNPDDLGSSPSAPATYVDDATGEEVTE